MIANEAGLLNLVAQLRSENNYLRKTTKRGSISLQDIGHTGRILRRALDDAGSLIVLHYGGYQVSRAMAYASGISERRYYWAMGLLRAARVVNGGEWVIEDATTAQNWIHARYEALKAHPDALELLRLRIPRKMGKMGTL